MPEKVQCKKCFKFFFRKRKKFCTDFPRDLVVKDLPASAGDTSPIPGPGRSHMLQIYKAGMLGNY